MDCPLTNRLRKAYDLVPECDKLLDIGCDQGNVSYYFQKKAKKVYGADTNKEAIAIAKKNYPGMNFFVNKNKLPFKKGYFDVVTATEVLEHVDDEEGFIREISRVLCKGGTLVLSTPHKGMFGFIDSFNLKYRFPRLYKLWKGKEYNPDIYKMEDWHRHYSLKQVKTLLDPYFDIVQVHRGGLILLPLLWVFQDMIIHKLIKNKKPWYEFTDVISDAEYQINFGRFGYNVMVKAVRK